MKKGKMKRTKKQMARDERRVLSAIKKERGRTTNYYLSKIHIPENQFYTTVRQLKDDGKLFKIGLLWFHMDDLPEGATITVQADEDPIIAATRALEIRIQSIECKVAELAEERKALEAAVKTLDDLLD